MAKRAVSGSRMTAGDAYAREADGVWRLDTDAVKARADIYLAEAEQAGRYSLAGLCIAMGITRETLDWWRRGFVCAQDGTGGKMCPDTALAELTAKTLLHLQRYWEESGKPASLGLKLLEATGALGSHMPLQSGGPPFELGRYKKYAK